MLLFYWFILTKKAVLFNLITQLCYKMYLKMNCVQKIGKKKEAKKERKKKNVIGPSSPNQMKSENK